MNFQKTKYYFTSYTEGWIFFSFLLTRIGFKWLSGADNFQLFYDSSRYDMLSNRIVNGNYNLDVTAFITAPFYPYFLATTKYLFGETRLRFYCMLLVLYYSGEWMPQHQCGYKQMHVCV